MTETMDKAGAAEPDMSSLEEIARRLDAAARHLACGDPLPLDGLAATVGAALAGLSPHPVPDRRRGLLALLAGAEALAEAAEARHAALAEELRRLVRSRNAGHAYSGSAGR